MKTKLFTALFSAGLGLITGVNPAKAQTYGQGNLATGAGCTAAGIGNSCTNTFVGSAAGAAINNNYTNNTFLGSTAGTSNTTGSMNTFIGQDCGASITGGSENAFVGKSAGRSCVTPDYNTFMGAHAAYYNTYAAFNDAFGWKALYLQSYANGNVTWETYNVAMGSRSLYTNNPTSSTNGWKNTALGHEAYYSNTTGSENTAGGYQAGYRNQTGVNNTLFGTQAGFGVANNSYSYNCMFGYQSGYSNTTGGSLALFGYKAGYTNTASYNSAFGAFAGYSNTSGDYNSFLGYGAGYNNTTGIRNTIIGHNALYFNQTGTHNTIVGMQAGYGSTTNSCSRNSFFGYNAGYTNTTGTNNTCIGYQTDGTGAGSNAWTNCTSLGNGALYDGNGYVVIGNTTVNQIGGWLAWTNKSDRRFKINVKEDVKGLEFIKKLRPVTYQMDTKKADDFLIKDKPDSLKTQRRIGMDFAQSTAVIHSGFIAQEVEQAAKDCGFKSSIVSAPADTNTGSYGLSYAEIVVPLVKAVQELSKTQDSLIAVINSLQGSGQRMMNNGGDEGSDHEIMNNETGGTPEKNKQDIKLALPDGATLGEPQPNPNSGSTQIPYYLPQNTSDARIIFTDMLGKVMEERALQPGYGALNIDTQDLPAGTYTYSLMVDGKVVYSKKMTRSR